MRRGTNLGLLTLVLLLFVVVSVRTVVGESNIYKHGLNEDIDPDDIVLDTHLDDGDTATWTIEHRFRLNDDADIASFESLQADIEDDPDPYLDRLRDRRERTAEAAETATNREMTIRDLSIETERRAFPREYGIVRYSFAGDGFAVDEGDRLHAGDAISAMFLDEGTTLRIRWDEPYTL